MQQFNEWLEIRDKALHEGMFDTMKNYGKQALVGGAMLGAGMGMAGNAQAGSNSYTSPDAKQYLQVQPGNTMSPYSWNDEIGRYKPIQQKDGSYIYQTKKGNFKRVPSNLSGNGYKFVRI